MPSAEMVSQGITHAIGTDKFPAPQGTLMATLVKGILSFNLDWQFVLVGVAIAITMELCGIKSLSFAVGLYLPLSTTLPIFIGGAIRGLVDIKKKKQGATGNAEEEDLGKGNLFATGLVAGGALAGVIIAFISAPDSMQSFLKSISMEHGFATALGENGYFFLGVLCFAIMGYTLYKIGMKKTEELEHT